MPGVCPVPITVCIPYIDNTCEEANPKEEEVNELSKEAVRRRPSTNSKKYRRTADPCYGPQHQLRGNEHENKPGENGSHVHWQKSRNH